ncbi:MAG: HD domain-containing protein [Clostridia bacterium]|nr:HD domain-containing protein [Clostridia bacterium]
MDFKDKITWLDIGSSSSDLTGTWQEDVPKTYYFLKGYALGKEYPNMQKSLIIARQLHSGQFRDGGAEYIVHPLRVCDYLVALGMNDDILLSSALLHDVIEDVSFIRDNPRILVSEFELSPKILDVVTILTKTKGMDKDIYFDRIKKDWRALFVKLSDRVNNISTLSSFDVGRRFKYIEETRERIIPLCSYGKLAYPQLSNKITCIKYHITSLCDTVKAITEQQEKERSAIQDTNMHPVEEPKQTRFED